jgi:glutamyl-Q tRNA(Asp) synthetase
VNAATVTRFAPSPTGYLHLGHAYSALFAARAANGGRFLLRIEDIDQGRCRAEFEAAIYEDLAWLGLKWETPVRRQSEHFDDYARALGLLDELGVLYPCFCTRKDIQAEIAGAGHAPHDVPAGPDGPVYPGTCRALSPAERDDRRGAGAAYALRLDMAKAVGIALEKAGKLSWSDRAAGKVEAEPAVFGDVVLARKDTPTSYHLAVTLDDDIQGVTLVTRGADLFAATHVHRLLQALLDLATPAYWHHPLLTGEDGRRFAKRDAAKTIRALREGGVTPEKVREIVELGAP